MQQHRRSSAASPGSASLVDQRGQGKASNWRQGADTGSCSRRKPRGCANTVGVEAQRGAQNVRNLSGTEGGKIAYMHSNVGWKRIGT